MIVANYLLNISTVPWWLKHAQDVGLTVIDLIAPFFIFAIGMTYGMAARRRAAREGGFKTFEHSLVRGLVLIGLGSLQATGQQWAGVDGSNINWGPLMAIGAATILSYAVIRLPIFWKLVIATALLAAYQTALHFYLLPYVLAAPHGGLPGSFGWTAMLIYASVFGDLFHEGGRRRRLFPWLVAAFLVAGIALAFVVPVSKNRVSASYVVICTALSGALFWLFHLVSDVRGVKLPLLSEWGVNPLILYILQGFLDAIFMLPPMPWWYAAAPVYVMIPEIAFLLFVMSLVAVFLRRKGLIFAL